MPISSPASKVVRFRSSWVFRRPDDAARGVRDAHKTTPSLRVLLRSRPSERRPRLAEPRAPTSDTDHLRRGDGQGSVAGGVGRLVGRMGGVLGLLALLL